MSGGDRDSTSAVQGRRQFVQTSLLLGVAKPEELRALLRAKDVMIARLERHYLTCGQLLDPVIEFLRGWLRDPHPGRFLQRRFQRLAQLPFVLTLHGRVGFTGLA